MSFRRKDDVNIFSRCWKGTKSIWILGDCISCSENCIVGTALNCKRRRNSYRLAGYFVMFVIISAVRIIVLMVCLFYLMNHFNYVPSKKSPVCFVDGVSRITFAHLQNHTLTSQQAPICHHDEDHVFSACQTGTAETLEIYYFVLVFESGISGALALILALLFYYYSGIPMRHFREGKQTWFDKLMAFLGGVCKHGLWFMSLLTFLRTFYLTSTVIILYFDQTHSCRGDIAKTYNCQTFQPECIYTQVMNCRYYASHHTDRNDTENIFLDPMNCQNYEEVKKFSSQVDIRLLPPGKNIGDMEESVEDCFRKLVSEYDFKNKDPRQTFEMIDPTLYGDIALNCTNPGILEDDEVPIGWDRAEPHELDLGEPGRCFRVDEAICLKASTKACEFPFDQIICSDNEEGIVMDPMEQVIPKIEEQECSTFPADDPQLFVSEETCSEQSFIYSTPFGLGVAVMLSEGLCFFLMITVGFVTRNFVEPEAWFYSPPTGREHRFWSMIRHIGPQ